jgi:tetratricopeptide (TPR) repeat protein
MVLSMALFSNNDFERVERSARRVIEIADFLGDRLSKNHMAIFQAFAWHRLGFSHRAYKLVSQIYNELSPAATGKACQILCSASRLLEDLGFSDLALKGYRDCVADCRRLSATHSLSIVLTYQGDLECENQQFEAAYRVHLEALELRRELDQNLGIATSLRGAGKALIGLGNPNLAKRMLQDSAQRFRDEDAQSGHASALILMAEAEALSGDLSIAIRLAENSIEILRSLGPRGRLTIGPSGAYILERAEALLQSMIAKRNSGNRSFALKSILR